MPWSNWYPLNVFRVNLNAPNSGGIYRIKLKDGLCFVLKSSDGNYYWEGIHKANNELVSCFSKNEPMRVCDCRSRYIDEVCTDLVYIGRSENIQQRLLQHINGNGSRCIAILLKEGYELFFSYLRREVPDDAEVNAFGRFVRETGGSCPPCDCGSNECSEAKGQNIHTYIVDPSFYDDKWIC